MSDKLDVCGVEHVKWLDNGFRRFVHNPRRMFGPCIKPGDTVVDIGCGSGTFLPGLANMVGPEGTIFAVDLQEEMLQLARGKADAAGVSDRVRFHRCERDSLGITLLADVVITVYMVHEAPDPLRLVDQVCALLKDGGYYYLSEPSFHVSRAQYREVVERCRTDGLSIVKESGILSRTAVFRKQAE